MGGTTLDESWLEVGRGSDKLEAERSAGSSAHDIWEPGSAMVPTFSLPTPVLGTAIMGPAFPPAMKVSWDGDLPLAGDGGGEPKRESWSSSV